jgi:hypothetical protein
MIDIPFFCNEIKYLCLLQKERLHIHILVALGFILGIHPNFQAQAENHVIINDLSTFNNHHVMSFFFFLFWGVDSLHGILNKLDIGFRGGSRSHRYLSSFKRRTCCMEVHNLNN